MFVTIDEFEELVSEVLDELPEEFFDGLSGGVIVEEEARLSEHAKDDDLYSLGTYTSDKRGGQITIFYGSFAKVRGWMQGDELKQAVRETVRHEFRPPHEIHPSMTGVQTCALPVYRLMRKYLDSHR